VIDFIIDITEGEIIQASWAIWWPQITSLDGKVFLWWIMKIQKSLTCYPSTFLFVSLVLGINCQKQVPVH